MLNELGGSLDPHACFLLHRGLKTLVLRMRHHNENALALARFLESRSEIGRVNYPGLSSHPDHDRARELFDGFSGMLSFEPVGGVEAAKRIMARLDLPIEGPSLGGLETLVTRPVTTSHAGLNDDELARAGVAAELVRVSVGVEHIDDLIADFTQALDG